MPGTKPAGPPATNVPGSAIPIAPPTRQTAFSVPEATPVRPGGAPSTTAAVAAGLVKEIPDPVAASGSTIAGYGMDPVAGDVHPDRPA